MACSEIQTDQLVHRALASDPIAMDRLMAAYRERLMKMVTIRMDRRLQGRVDAADVVQDTLLQASRRLREYTEQKVLPFYPWLRQLAINRLDRLYRQHIGAQKRSVLREQSWHDDLPDQSIDQMVNCLAASGTSPSTAAARSELRRHVHEALQRLDAVDREVLILTYLEAMSSSEIAAVLGITARTVRRRHRLAVQRMAELLKVTELFGKESP